MLLGFPTCRIMKPKSFYSLQLICYSKKKSKNLKLQPLLFVIFKHSKLLYKYKNKFPTESGSKYPTQGHLPLMAFFLQGRRLGGTCLKGRFSKGIDQVVNSIKISGSNNYVLHGEGCWACNKLSINTWGTKMDLLLWKHKSLDILYIFI